MKIVTDINQWVKLRKSLAKDKSIGVVMTMGTLHKGHLSLVEKSKKENDITIVTIFLNPTQFNNQSDFINYPKTWEEDVDLLENAEVNFLLSPIKEDIYPDNYNYQLSEKSLSKILCGKSRPGHFDGVLTIVMKLLQLTQADKAYFGEKDFQQLYLIKEMAKAFFVPTEIIGCPIIRESDGLAFSSRNLRLSEKGREKARIFAELIKLNKPLKQIEKQLEQNDIQVDYLEEHFDRRFAAAFIEEVRLIDNFSLEEVKA
ncbi:pantoate--beta-alanine ligase [Francisella frigiditurris]|uniref:Pantothenate synthetase n=1 Tax=Francisella frigiditurris TaxID=1542390 RepID=A0A1J0KU30_9GAMM|nr:pantoate--beta-alanine ligase [Francisella frigiditurris]APC97195.1 pantoate--beta-alanine ligase [Francisella frigiditurris]